MQVLYTPIHTRPKLKFHTYRKFGRQVTLHTDFLTTYYMTFPPVYLMEDRSKYQVVKM